MDMLVLQEIIFETKPKYIIETGTARGGMALFMAHMLDLLGDGTVITIDIEDRCEAIHSRIIKILGDSTSEEVFKRVSSIVNGNPCMVFLDSLHNKQHVLKELELYSRLVKPGHYIVVADTNVNGHPVLLGFGEVINGRFFSEGPMEAVYDFINKHPQFIIDKGRERLLSTFFRNGYLERVR